MTNILNLITRGEWVSYTDHAVGAREPDRGLVHIAAVASQRRPAANEGEANQKLIVLAPDHALFALAMTMNVAAVSEHIDSGLRWVSVGPAGSVRRAFACGLDVCDVPALTSDLRAFLRGACGLEVLGVLGVAS